MQPLHFFCGWGMEVLAVSLFLISRFTLIDSGIPRWLEWSVVLVPVHTFRKKKRVRGPGEFYGLGSCFCLCTFMQAGARSPGALSISPLGAVDGQKIIHWWWWPFFPSISFGAKIRAQTLSDAKRELCFSADIMIIHRMNLARVFRRLTLHAQEWWYLFARSMANSFFG